MIEPYTNIPGHELAPCQVSGHQYEDGFCASCGDHDDSNDDYDVTEMVLSGPYSKEGFVFTDDSYDNQIDN